MIIKFVESCSYEPADLLIFKNEILPLDEEYFDVCLKFAYLHQVAVVSATFISDNQLMMAFINPKNDLIVKQTSVCKASSPQINYFTFHDYKLVLSLQLDNFQPKIHHLYQQSGVDIVIANFEVDDEIDELIGCGPWMHTQNFKKYYYYNNSLKQGLIKPLELTYDRLGFSNDIEINKSNLILHKDVDYFDYSYTNPYLPFYKRLHNQKINEKVIAHFFDRIEVIDLDNQLDCSHKACKQDLKLKVVGDITSTRTLKEFLTVVNATIRQHKLEDFNIIVVDDALLNHFFSLYHGLRYDLTLNHIIGHSIYLGAIECFKMILKNLAFLYKVIIVSPLLYSNGPKHFIYGELGNLVCEYDYTNEPHVIKTKYANLAFLHPNHHYDYLYFEKIKSAEILINACHESKVITNPMLNKHILSYHHHYQMYLVETKKATIYPPFELDSEKMDLIALKQLESSYFNIKNEKVDELLKH